MSKDQYIDWAADQERNRAAALSKERDAYYFTDKTAIMANNKDKDQQAAQQPEVEAQESEAADRKKVEQLFGDQIRQLIMAEVPGLLDTLTRQSLGDVIDARVGHQLLALCPTPFFRHPKKSDEIGALVTAVLSVMAAVKSVEKGATVGSGSYSYKGVSDKDVKQAFNKAMAENGLVIFTIDLGKKTDVNRFQKSNGDIGQSIFVEVEPTYLLTHVSGQWVELRGLGHGIDSMDKAAGKATTYALKYTLLYTFLTPTGQIDDADNHHSQEAPPPPPADKVQLPLSPTVQSPADEVPEQDIKRWKAQLALLAKLSEVTNLFKANLPASEHPTLKALFTARKEEIKPPAPPQATQGGS